MLEAFFSSVLLVTMAEMGDKTQLLAFVLMCKLKKPLQIMLGILVATLLNHALAASAGVWISNNVPENTMRIVLSISFIAFGIWALIPDKLDKETKTSKYGAFLNTAIVFFFVEMGDKTQLATVALGAKFKSLAPVLIGTTTGMLIADGLAVFLGAKLSDKIPMKWMRIVAASLFFILGIIIFFKK
jgi:Ca2+/H+ antiporter, TMEM165/GDT1 family